MLLRPRILDVYITRRFVATLFFGMLSLCVLFIIVHLFENLDGFLDRKTPPSYILAFYLNYLPEIIKLTTPVAVLLSGLFTMGRFATMNELTAMKAGGQSVIRTMLPLLALGIILSGVQWYFDGWIVPRANHFKAEFERIALGKGRLETSLYNVYVRETPTHNLIIGYYDDLTKSGSGFRLEEYSSEHQPRIVRRIFAGSFRYDTVNNTWLLTHVCEYRFSLAMHVQPTVRIMQELSVQTHTTPATLMYAQRNTSELTFPELKEYIDASERGGNNVRQQRIAYWGEQILPLANVIVMFFAVLPSSGRRKAGLALEITTAMIIAFLYIACVRIGQTLGLANDAHPAFVAALPHVLFFAVGVVNLMVVRT
ncbi:MAG: LptF/LptG family permease [Bacteroidota bacterium]|nr:LptF/LptG family permease [Candidatus Kapabacteria bacterium]MDW8219351.1 LptF/LptG family permease [Bacteroidota bacterium]